MAIGNGAFEPAITEAEAGGNAPHLTLAATGSSIVIPDILAAEGCADTEAVERLVIVNGGGKDIFEKTDVLSLVRGAKLIILTAFRYVGRADLEAFDPGRNPAYLLRIVIDQPHTGRMQLVGRAAEPIERRIAFFQAVAFIDIDAIMHHVGRTILRTQHDFTEAAADEQIIFVDLVVGGRCFQLHVETEGQTVVGRRRAFKVNFAVFLHIDASAIALGAVAVVEIGILVIIGDPLLVVTADFDFDRFGFGDGALRRQSSGGDERAGGKEIFFHHSTPVVEGLLH